ncbi:MAG TPA: hypothetical protein VIK25_10090 [Gemmatimonadaceae bacterium]
MPTSKSATVKRDPAFSAHEPPVLQCAADAMFRAADECCRQQARLSRVLELSCGEAELEGVIEVSVVSARVLETAGAQYTGLASESHDGLDEACWHAANTMWHASREYARRHQACNVKSAKLSRHAPAQLGALAVEYELKASAVLALRYSVEQYAKARPEVR